MLLRIQLHLIVAALFCGHALAAENVLLLEDFDSGVKLSRRWTAVGKIGVARTDAPAESVEGVGGMLADCDAKPQSTFVVNRDFERPPYENYDTIRFRMLAKNASEEKPLAFEFKFFSQDRRAALWRKFTVDSDEWQIIELPMQHFRYTGGANLDWNEVARFGVYFRDSSKVLLDGFELVAQQQAANPYFTSKEIGEFAFGEKLLTSENEHFVVLTNEPRVDRKQTLAECKKLYGMVYADFPDLPKPTRKIPTLIFAEKKDYEQFWSKFGGLYVSQVPPVRASGYSLLGVAGTSYSDEFGPVRPVLLHEACHSLLGPAIGLSNGSEWLHEGLANYYQLNWTKQDVFDLNREPIKRGRHRPLRELLNGKRISIRDYAQVTLFMKWLLEDDDRKQQLFAAMKEMRLRNSTKLEPISEEFFGKSLDNLELEWLRWARSK